MNLIYFFAVNSLHKLVLFISLEYDPLENKELGWYILKMRLYFFCQFFNFYNKRYHYERITKK